MYLPFSLFAAAFVAAVSASNVVDLTPETFDQNIISGKPGLVEFFAPWCGHCKNLAPVYEQLADAYSHAKDKVVIAKIDADGVGKPTGKKYGVTGYPTLKWFDGTDAEPEAYSGGRDLESLANFIYKKTGVRSKIKQPPPPATLQLDANNFDEVVMDETKDVLVAFTASWCGHCKAMKPAYEKTSVNFLPETNCVIANFEADADKNIPLSQKYEIGSFPTLKFFSKGNKVPEDYNGGRTEEDFTEFLNSKCGTQRKAGGGLNEVAGRIPTLDSLAAKFFTASAEAKSSVYQEAVSLASSAGATSQHYLKVMQKVVNGTNDYVEKESRRLASILTKGTLSPAKLDEIKIKANILAAFAEEKAEEVKEKVEEIIEEATEHVKEL
ncbi:protein disulfide isomerase [Sistotremastrum niveocremeum HHB9708]|uniref:protein disulfide-isomerase n=1 Tax=Sistotremastrum niveocremeum HHB9708 TaxID=1314777 RepID=A0A164NW87_9AGAM|nr:protein disulfide isomerase [Sistotremastrum niveocremeum HHB9708]